MRDPHIHVEKTPMPGFGNAAIRELILTATGLASDMPKTVGTGCDKRRPMAMTSSVPEHVTCLACREYGAHIWAELAESAESLMRLLIADPEFASTAKVVPDKLRAEAAKAREMSARFGKA